MLSSAPSSLSSFHSGNYDKLQTLATSAVIDAIKSERTRKLRGLRLSWKLHKVIAREVVCARQQEIKKANEHVAQMAVRFITEQVGSLSSVPEALAAC